MDAHALVIADLEARLMPQLREAQKRLGEQFPDLSFSVWSSPTGSLTPWQGYDLGIEVEVPVTTPSEQPNWLVLTVSTHHLTSNPRLQASVTWGYSRGFLVDVGWPDAIPLNDESLDQLSAELPKLLASFETAVRTGHTQ